MALGPRLDLRQSQSLVMTPQLQQAIKLLAASNLEIEAFIGEALEANPLLEAGEMRVEDREAPPESVELEIHDASPGDGDQALDIDAGALDRDRDTGDGDWGAAGAHVAVADELPSLEDRASNETTLADYLEEQVGAAAGDAREAFVARAIIGQLDEAGYLVGELRHIAADLGVGIAEAERALEIVQSLDPTGVGARSLSECLALQAKEADRYDPCMARLIDNLELVARGEVQRLKRMCDVDDEDFAEMLAELRSYNPKPGLAYGRSEASAVVPDILVTRGDDNSWDIKLNEATLPRLVVNRDYYVELRNGSPGKEAQSWLREKLADANWLIKALDQRQKTILKTAAEIVKKQEGFFRRGVSELRPLTLREVAEEIDMHESTVSRVTSNKYLHCERGCFELKYFFSSGVGRVGEGADGEGASAEAVKARIKALVDGEDAKKILSDQKLVDILKGEGFDLARRTVAKYREAIGIGSSAQRRRQKKLQGL
ncbi:RNA polymerase factor sigma-54 [Altererythrobacter arenosus]|uniref:RNA polymerase sigma-54 factor n=1 Tax=Altererythrobacter arenosus TaxID=3032592 RepID=A0ABY8G1X6_9SPHN|nr:RNA polymerase factor sigma-54 [Altererythrobacter sp. CAU 1644]WFL78889.1 RNA polymerase factor sigma-54 [Altererythrobacter sp. CAU 1644]